MKSYVAVLVAALCLTSTVAAQDEKQAQKILKTSLAEALKAQTQALKGLLAPATDTLQEAKAAASSGAAAPGDSVAGLAQILTLLVRELAQDTSDVIEQEAVLDVDEALEAAGLPLPTAALVGTGGVFDKRLAKIDKKYLAAVAKSRKAAFGVLKVLTKQGVPASLSVPDVALPRSAPGFFGTGVQAPQGEGAFVLPPLQITTLIGFSDGDVPGDGSLQISGFTFLTDEVILTGRGPEGAGFGPLKMLPEDDGTFTALVTGLAEGNWRVQAKQPIALCTDYVGIPGAPDPGTDATTAKELAKADKAGWKALSKQHAKTLKEQAKLLKAQFKAARKAVLGGAEPDAVLADVFADLDSFQDVLDEASNGATGVVGGALAGFGATLDGLDQVDAEHLVGYGHANDQTSAQIEKRLKKRAAMATKMARGFAKFLAKKSDGRLAVGVEPVRFGRAAPVKGAELSEPLSPLRFEILMGSSEADLQADGVMRLRINGDDEIADRIDLALYGPADFAVVATIHSPDVIGGLDLRFPESGPGNLPEGNYVIVARQGSVVVSGAVAIPGGSLTAPSE